MLATDYSYPVGGSLQLNSALYISRPADCAVVQAVKSGQFCAVTAPPRMGKSSLRLRASQQLSTQGYRCATVYGSQLIDSPKDYYRWEKQLISNLWDGLFPTDFAPLSWWLKQTDDLLPQVRLEHFTRDVLFKKLTESPVVVFIDAAEALLNIPFLSDDIFEWITHCYKLRKLYPVYQNLNFVVCSTAQPERLIKNEWLQQQGEFVSIKPLKQEQSSALITELDPRLKAPEVLLDAIFRWTNGHPQLTQQLCGLAVSTLSKIDLNESDIPFPEALNQWIDELVQTAIIETWSREDGFKYLVDTLLLMKQSQRSDQLFALCQQIVADDAVVLDASPLQYELILTGLAAPQEGYLRIANEIYRHILIPLL